MYNTQLETFVRVAELSSFAKAAQAMYVSPTAVIKQINLLEGSLDVKLFDRTHRGVSLTDAGRSFYRDSKFIIQYSQDAIARARTASGRNHCIRIGTSVLTAHQFLVALLPKVQAACPNLQIQVVPFENTQDNSNAILRNMGRDIDIVIAMCEMAKPVDYAVLPLSYKPICCAVSVLHPLAQKDRLTVEDLYGQNFILAQRGFNSHIDLLRDFLEKKHPQVRIVDVPFINIELFNRCESSGDVMFAFEKWQGKHPLLKIMPVDWSFTVPFGLLYSHEPPDSVRSFINAAMHSYRAVIQRRGQIV